MRAAVMITAKRNIRPPFQILYIRSYCDQTPTTDNQFAITNRFPFLSPSLSILGTSLSLSLYLSLYLSVHFLLPPSSIEFTADADMHSVREGDRLHPGSSTTGKLPVPWLHSVQPFGTSMQKIKIRHDWRNEEQINKQIMKYTKIRNSWNIRLLFIIDETLTRSFVKRKHDRLRTYYNAYSTVLLSYHIFRLIKAAKLFPRYCYLRIILLFYYTCYASEVESRIWR